MIFHNRKSNLAEVRRWPLVIFWVLLTGSGFAAVAAAASVSSARPPTVDPTYGLPLPEAPADALGKPPGWIWASTVGNHQSVYLYRTLTLKSLPVKPVVYVTADNYFTLYINGKRTCVMLNSMRK